MKREKSIGQWCNKLIQERITLPIVMPIYCCVSKAVCKPNTFNFSLYSPRSPIDINILPRKGGAVILDADIQLEAWEVGQIMGGN